jgi:hypothetical protein
MRYFARAEFLGVFAQGGLLTRFAGFDHAAGKTDLAGVRLHVRWSQDCWKMPNAVLGIQK